MNTESRERPVATDDVPTTSRPAEPAAYELVYREALRSITEQQQVLSDLRGRGQMLLAGAAIAASFLGSAALADGVLGAAGRWAVFLFALLGVLVVAILFPVPGWRFRFRPDKLLETYVEREDGADALSDIHRDLALHLESYYGKNRVRLGVLQWLHRAASALLVAQVIFWLIELSPR